MELRQGIHRVTTWPTTWIATVLLAIVLGLLGWYALPNATRSHPTNVARPTVTAANSLLDRNAERQQQGPISRDGGPGGQVGDVP